MRASQLTTLALGLKPGGAPALKAHTCTFCGEGIAVGDLCEKLDVGPTFMDDAYLTARETPGWLCGHCATLKAKPVMDYTQQSFITTKGVYRFGRTENRKWLLQNLPEPPFVIVSSDTKSQHMIWKTPVTRFRDLLYLRIGWRQFTVRMPLVRALVAMIPSLKERVIAHSVAGTKRKPKASAAAFNTPFVTTEPSVSDLNYGRIRANILPVLTPEELTFLRSFSPGEVWATGVLASPKPPVEPEFTVLKK